MKKIKTIEKVTYRKLKELLEMMPEEDLDCEITAGFSWYDGYDYIEEWEDVETAELCETDEGGKFISLYLTSHENCINS